MSEVKTRGMHLVWLSCLVAVFLGALGWFQKKSDVQEQHEATSKKIFPTLDISTIKAVALTTPTTTFQLTRSETDQSWALTQPQAIPADGVVVQGMLKSLQDLTATKTLDDPQLKILGLEKPRFHIVLTRLDGKTQALKIGIKNTYDGSIYVQNDAVQSAHVVSGDLEFQWDKSLHDLREKRILVINSSDIQTIDVQAPAGKYTLSMAQDGGMILASHNNQAVDKTHAETIVAGLSSLNASQFSDEKIPSPLPSVDWGEPYIKVHVKLRSGVEHRFVLKQHLGESYLRVDSQSLWARLSNAQLFKRLNVSDVQLRALPDTENMNTQEKAP